MMVNKSGAVVCCVCLVSAVLAEISLRVKQLEGRLQAREEFILSLNTFTLVPF